MISKKQHSRRALPHCRQCGVVIPISFPCRVRQFCTRGCRHAFEVGAHNPNYRGGPIERACRTCGKLFTQARNGAELNLTCSKGCKSALLKSRRFVTRGHQRWTNRARRCLNTFLREGTGGQRKWSHFLGYSPKEYQAHILSNLSEGMSMQNYGTHWEIDHVRPSSSFPYETPDDPSFRECWGLSNLRPLRCSENLKKGFKHEK